MTTQYTSILKLALPVQGELSGTWGDVVNDNITSMVEQAIAGRAVALTYVNLGSAFTSNPVTGMVIPNAKVTLPSWAVPTTPVTSAFALCIYCSSTD